MSRGGKKFDTGKADLSMVPLPALEAEAKAFMLGEEKYGRYNYLEGMSAVRLLAAAQRHLSQWLWEKDDDDESGVSHLGHARACLGMVLHLESEGTLIDDRYKREITDVMHPQYNVDERNGYVEVIDGVDICPDTGAVRGNYSAK